MRYKAHKNTMQKKSDMVELLFFTPRNCAAKKIKTRALLLCVIESRAFKCTGIISLPQTERGNTRRPSQITSNETINKVKLHRAASTACHYEPVVFFILHCLLCACRNTSTLAIYCVCAFYSVSANVVASLFIFEQIERAIFHLCAFARGLFLYFCIFFSSFSFYNLYLVFGCCLCENAEVENTKTKGGGWANEKKGEKMS